MNADEVRARAVKYGFEIVNPGVLSLAEQVRVISEARMICGPHGAGLANAVDDETLLNQLPHRHAGIEAAERVLEHDLEMAAHQPQLARSEGE